MNVMNSLPSKGIKRVIKHLLLTVIHDGDGNTFARVAQLPSFRHIKIQPGGPVCLACVYLITQMRVTCVIHVIQVRKSVNIEEGCVCFYICEGFQSFWGFSFRWWPITAVPAVTKVSHKLVKVMLVCLHVHVCAWVVRRWKWEVNVRDMAHSSDVPDEGGESTRF